MSFWINLIISCGCLLTSFLWSSTEKQCECKSCACMTEKNCGCFDGKKCSCSEKCECASMHQHFEDENLKLQELPAVKD